MVNVLILDGMGVIYSVSDDVRDLLCPFVAEKGGTLDAMKIGRLYREASLGHISAAEFWRGVDVDPRLEDAYLQRHQLTAGTIKFLDAVKLKGIVMWLLSNDVPQWSVKLRARFGLEPYFHGFVVSGDVGVRKPDTAIYKILMECVAAHPQDLLFVDDSRKNLDAAAALGLQTMLFSPAGDVSPHDPNPDPVLAPPGNVTTNHPIAQTLDEVLAKLS